MASLIGITWHNMAKGQAEVLLLDSAAHGEARGWRSGENYIDALAYIDPLSEEQRAEVGSLYRYCS